jgi:multiple sugar transport system substrate-binding protein
MKKLALLLMSLLMLSSLVGCSVSNTNDSETIKLTFWGHQNEPWNESYRQIGEKFTAENPGIEVSFEFFPYDQFESKVQTSLISKEGGADIYEMWGGWGVDFASTGALAVMPDAMAKDVIDHVYPSTIGALMYDGKLYGLPLEFNIENGGLLVNKTLLKDANIPVPTTWAELVSAGTKLTKEEGGILTQKGFDFVNWDSVPYMFLSMILSTGGQYLDANGKFTLQTPEAKAALQELYDMVVVDKVTDLEGLVGGGDLEGYQQLYAGRNAMVPRGPWVISEGTSSFGLTLGVDFDYVEMPWFGDKAAFAAETGWALSVNGSSKQQEAAYKFLEYFYQDENLLAHNVAATQIPAKISVAQDPELLNLMPFAKPLVKILGNAQFIGYFNTDQFKEAVNNTFVDLVMGTTPSVDEALISLEEYLNTNVVK